MDPLLGAVERLSAAAGDRLRAKFEPFVPASGGLLRGGFEVRGADGRVKRIQSAELPLPAPLVRAFAHRAPSEVVRIDFGSHALTLWPPAELIELQVGHRWHGFNGKRMREWDERFVVFAEDDGDPLALRLDELDGPVWLSYRGEGRHAFSVAAPDLATFYEALALWIESGRDGLLGRLHDRFGERAQALWLVRRLHLV